MHQIVLFGKPNVGKSSLFNILCGNTVSIVCKNRNTTRDIVEKSLHKKSWNITLCDSPGLSLDSQKELQSLFSPVKEFVLTCLQKSDLILIVLDIHNINSEDNDILRIAREQNKPYLVCANKWDHDNHDLQLANIQNWGIQDYIPISCTHFRGIQTLRKTIQTILPLPELVQEEILPPKRIFRISLMGRPNAGKSSLLNILLGKQRSLVSEIPGTTRDVICEKIPIQGKNQFIEIVDTAGIRKKSKEKQLEESLSVGQTLRILLGSEVCLLLIDATEGITHQDKTILSVAQRKKKLVIIVFTKWDLVKSQKKWKEFLIDQSTQFAELDYFMCLPTSCVTKENVATLISVVTSLFEKSQKKINGEKLQDVLNFSLIKNPPPGGKNSLKIRQIRMEKTIPPSFVISVNYPDKIPGFYSRYIQKMLREELDLQYIPFGLHFVESFDQSTIAAKEKF